MRYVILTIYVVIAIALAWFSARNWQSVDVALYADLILSMPLAIIMIGMFLLGFLPLLVFGGITRWNLRRKLRKADKLQAAQTQELAEARKALADAQSEVSRLKSARLPDNPLAPAAARPASADGGLSGAADRPLAR